MDTERTTVTIEWGFVDTFNVTVKRVAQVILEGQPVYGKKQSMRKLAQD